MAQPIKKRDIPFITLFLLPGLLLFVVTILIPSVLAISYSLYQADSFVSQPTFIGLQNYIEVISEQRFWSDLWKTILYAGCSVLLQVIIGIAIALILNENFVGREFLRGISVIPYIIPPIAVAIVWEWMLDSNWGVVNQFISMIGFDKIAFLSSNMVMWTAVFISVWTWTPFVTLVFLAGLQTIPSELYESASLEGANPWQLFWKITLPMLKPVITTIILLRGIWMFNKFDLMWILTGGGPAEKTETLPILTYLYTFKLQRVGAGSTIAIIALIIMTIGMLLYLRMMNADEKEESIK